MNRAMFRNTIFMLFTIIGFQSFSQKESSIVPEWVQDHWDYVTQGEWIAPNPYQSEAIPFDSYGMRFEVATGGMVITGKLYGIKNGKEVKTLWKFVNYWHPGEKRLIQIQYGNNPRLGNIAIGEGFDSGDPTRDESIVESFKNDGSTFKVGHKSEYRDNKIISNSFDVLGDEWKPRGNFVWTLKDQ